MQKTVIDYRAVTEEDGGGAMLTQVTFTLQKLNS